MNEKEVNTLKNSDKVLFHYTCLYHIREIMQSGYLKTTESNFSLDKCGLYPVVWLTSSLSPQNIGLDFADGRPDFIDKKRIRLTLWKKIYMKPWDDWSQKRGMNIYDKQALIYSADKNSKSYKTWYVSERNIILDNSLLFIEDTVTGELLYSAFK